ncbi:MAG: hypothetical protein LWW98_08440, partial [Deltaproteobacteria bacterium]|nr:hypothetical protein [Deltaproteobacteria bacterium]
LHINSISDFSEFFKVVPGRPFNLCILICYPDTGYGASGNSRFKLLCSSICNLLICSVRMFTDEFLDGFADAVNIFPGGLGSTIILIDRANGNPNKGNAEQGNAVRCHSFCCV